MFFRDLVTRAGIGSCESPEFVNLLTYSSSSPRGIPDVLEDTVPPYRGIFVSATKLFTISGAPRPFERSQREFLTKRICYLFEFQGCTWRVRLLSPPLGAVVEKEKGKGGFLDNDRGTLKVPIIPDAGEP